MSNKQTVFLATNNIDIINNNDLNTFIKIGEWKSNKGNQKKSENLKHSLKAPGWYNSDELHNIYEYLNSVYKEIITELKNSLNRLHKTNHSIKYWDIFIGCWLHHYIEISYDRFMTIKKTKDKYPYLKADIKNQKIIAPKGMVEFLKIYGDDDNYNQLLYNRIISYLGINIEVTSFTDVSKQSPNLQEDKKTKKIINTVIDSIKTNGIKGFLRIVAKKIKDYFLPISPKRPFIVFHHSYFPNEVEKEIQKNFDREIYYFPQVNNSSQNYQIDRVSRNSLDLQIKGKDEFLNYLRSVIHEDILQCYIEEYKEIKRINKKLFNGKKPKAIFTALWPGFDSAVFKEWAAQCSEKGTLLLGTNHAPGAYGIMKFLSLEDYEFNICDYYYTWGWPKNEYPNKTIEMPAPTLINKKEYHKNNNSKNILFITNSCPRYFYRLQYMWNPYEFDLCIHWGHQFYKSLDNKRKKEFILRTYPTDYGRGQKEEWLENFPEIQMDEPGQHIDISIKNSRLLIVDHSGTTFGTALALNKAIIGIWNPEILKLRDSAKSCYNLLHKVGIIHYTPEAAAAFINENYDNIEEWWYSDKVQNARKQFSNLFTRQSDDSVNEWINEFKRILSL